MHEVDVCKRYVRVAFSHTGPKEAIFTRLRCKQWSCDYCAKKNASIWRAFLATKLPEIGENWHLVTLTANSQTRSAKASLANIRDNFDRLLKRVRRVFGKVEYVRVYEKHPSSEAIHLHAVFFGLTPFVAIGCSAKLQPMAIGATTRRGRNGVWALKTWIKKVAQECTMGYIADARLVVGELRLVVWYITKYLTKSQQDIKEKGVRHVQTSRGVGAPKNEKDQIWHTSAYIVASMFAPNAQILDLNTGNVVDNQYWEKRNFYPYDD